MVYSRILDRPRPSSTHVGTALPHPSSSSRTRSSTRSSGAGLESRTSLLMGKTYKIGNGRRRVLDATATGAFSRESDAKTRVL